MFDVESFTAVNFHLCHKTRALRAKWNTLIVGWDKSIYGRTAIEGGRGRGRVLEIGDQKKEKRQPLHDPR